MANQTISIRSSPGRTDKTISLMSYSGNSFVETNLPMTEVGTLTGVYKNTIVGGTYSGAYYGKDESDAIWHFMMANVTDEYIGRTEPVTGNLLNTTGALPATIAAGAIANSAITAASIDSDAITAAKIADGAIDTATFATGTTIPRVTLTDTLTTYTGNTPQTGDSFARIGSTGSGLTTVATAANLATVAGYIDTEIADIQSRLPAALVSGRMDVSVGAMAANTLTASALASDAVAEIQSGLSTAASIAALNNISTAQVNAEVDTALADIRLDELLSADSDIDGAAPPAVGSVFHELMSKTSGSFTFDQTTDSNEAIRDAVTAGGTALDAAGVRSAVGLASANLDTQLSAIDDFLDTEVAAIKAKTDQLTFTVSNQVDANALTGDGLTAAETRAALGLASANLDSQLGDLPTNAELATALGTSDDAVLAAIAALNNLSAAQVASLLAILESDLSTDHGSGSWATATGFATVNPDNASITAIKAKTDNLPSDPADQSAVEAAITAATTGLATAANLALVKTDTAAILADTGTDGVVLSAAMMNKIADHTRRRTQANVEASSDGDALSLGSEYGFLQQAQESSVASGVMTVKKTDGVTTLGTKALTSDAAADPIVGIS